MRLTRWGIVAVTLSFGTGGFPRPVAAQPPEAVAEIRDANGTWLGRATFSTLPGQGGVWIQVNVANLPPGLHGITIHEHGVCQGPDFATAGGPFNPRGRKHGLMHSEGAHGGELPDIVVSDAGKARYEAANVRITLGDGPTSLFRPGGTSLVVHAGPDDHLTDPMGNSGPAIACGVIVRPKS